MYKACSEADIVLFGELHNDPIAHWLQFKLTQKMLLQFGRNIVLGAEMFEADNQKELFSFIKGEINQKEMDTVVRLWPNYYTDYAPLVALSIEHKVPFIATNIPRPLLELYSKKGLKV